MMPASIDELQRAVDELQLLIEAVSVPLFAVDTQGCITEWNRKAMKVYGYAKEELKGRVIVEELFPSNHREQVQAILDQALQGRETSNFEAALLTQAGSTMDILLDMSPRYDVLGNVMGAVGVAREICDFQAAEISGWDRVEVSGKPVVSNAVPEGERAEVARALDAALDSGDAANYQFSLCTRDGQRREVLLNATARRNASGEIIGVIGVGQDITELNQQRREAERIADDLSRLIDTANTPIFGVDKQARVTVWNQKIAELSGYPYEAVIDEKFERKFDMFAQKLDEARKETAQKFDETRKEINEARREAIEATRWLFTRFVAAVAAIFGTLSVWLRVPLQPWHPDPQSSRTSAAAPGPVP